MFCENPFRVKEGFARYPVWTFLDCVIRCYPVWTFVDCVSYDIETFIELGKTFGLEGAELLAFVEKQQQELEERHREEEQEEKRREEEREEKRREEEREEKHRGE